MWFGGCLLLLGLMQFATAEEGVIVVEGGGFEVEKYDGIYGNDPIKRGTYILHGGPNSYVDMETSLPCGRLTMFAAYIHNAEKVEEETTPLRLQVWRPVPTGSQVPTFMLIYEKEIIVKVHHVDGALYMVYLTENPEIQEGDKIGWTFTDYFGNISSSYKAGHHIFFHQSRDDPLPEVNEAYEFHEQFMPAIFSIAAGVEAGANC